MLFACGTPFFLKIFHMFKAYSPLINCHTFQFRLGKLSALRAPVITILDHRGCESNKDHKEYKGKPSGDENDGKRL